MQEPDARLFTIYTVGHGNRSADGLAALLAAHGVDLVCDVRSFPRSRRWPHFDRAVLEAFLPDRGIGYEWLGQQLGGFRKTQSDSVHLALDESFRGYADHMATEGFHAGLDRLHALAAQHTVACMCAELDWTHCHRRYLSDALVAENIVVLHARDPGAPKIHRRDARSRIRAKEGRGGRPLLIYDIGTQTRFGV